jgi:ribosomal protein S1
LKLKLQKTDNRFFTDLTVGQEIEGTVVRLMPYGAFVELLRLESKVWCIFPN